MLHNSKRSDDSGKRSKEWLQWIDEERCIQAAMLADAADESLMLSRLMDAEAVDPAVLTRELHHYRQVIDALYGPEAKVLDTFGFTKCMLDELKQPMVWAVSGKLRSLGGGSLDVVVQKCLTRMRLWQQKLMPAVIEAEFPDYEIQQVFDLAQMSSLLLPQVSHNQPSRRFSRSSQSFREGPM